MSDASDILAWLNAEQRKAERWGYSATGVYRFQLTGPELMRIRAALGAPKERLYHDIQCPTLTKTGPCNCTTHIIVADGSSVQATGEPPSVSAVDPVPANSVSGPRATGDSSSETSEPLAALRVLGGAQTGDKHEKHEDQEFLARVEKPEG